MKFGLGRYWIMALCVWFATLEGKANTIKIPFRYVQSFIIVEVKLENIIPLKLIFDTGAEHSLLFERKYTDVLPNPYAREIKLLGSDLKQEIPAFITMPMRMHIALMDPIEVNLIVMKKKEIFLEQVIGEQIHGILSAYLFKDYIIEINYKRQYILLHNRARYNFKKDGFVKQDIHIYKNKPYIHSSAQFTDTTVTSLNLLLDSGAGVSLLLYPNSNSEIIIPDKIIPGYLGSGIGGVIEGYICKLKSFSFSQFTFPQVVCNVQNLESEMSYKESEIKNGLIGNLILDRFQFVLDYMGSAIYLKPYKKYNEPAVVDKSGMIIISGGLEFRNYFVSHIIPGGPADLAGIQPGDQLIRINGISSALYTLSRIHQLLHSKSGKKVRLSFQRKELRYKTEIYLKDLI